MDRICLKGLRIYACHGVFAEEKQQKQLFIVNVEMGVHTSAAAQSDDIDLSVDYSRVYTMIRLLMEENCFNLLETVAERIAALLLTDERVHNVRVEVEKSRAAFQGQFFSASVVIERSRA